MKRFRIEEKKARDAKKNGGKAGGASSAADLKAKKEAEEAAKVEEEKKAEEAKKAEAEDKVSFILDLSWMVGRWLEVLGGEGESKVIEESRRVELTFPLFNLPSSSPRSLERPPRKPVKPLRRTSRSTRRPSPPLSPPPTTSNPPEPLPPLPSSRPPSTSSTCSSPPSSPRRSRSSRRTSRRPERTLLRSRLLSSPGPRRFRRRLLRRSSCSSLRFSRCFALVVE